MRAQKTWKQMVAMSLAALLALAPMATAQEKVAPRSQANKTARAERQESRGRSQEGIKVHGHWTIDVKSPEGTLVSHTEFENALVQQGSAFLVSVLAGQHTANKWAVLFDGPSPRPCLISGSPAACVIAQPGLSFAGTGSSTSFNLMVQAPTSGPNAGALVLQGFIAADFSTQINSVATYLFEQTGSSATAGGPFTGTFPAPINVAAGQIVQVTVVISFS